MLACPEEVQTKAASAPWGRKATTHQDLLAPLQVLGAVLQQRQGHHSGLARAGGRLRAGPRRKDERQSTTTTVQQSKDAVTGQAG